MPSLRGFVSAIAIVAAAAPAASGATVVRVPTLEGLVRAAPRIVVTEVVEVRAERARGRDEPAPVTLVTFRVTETLKGAPALQLVLEFAGGQVDETRLVIGGMPRFVVGERDVLFLHGAPGMLSPILGVFAGRFPVHGDFVVARASTPVPLALFARSVRAIAAAQGAEATPAPPAESPTSLVAGRPAGVPLPGCLHVNLGPSPALANGCPDWICAVGLAIDAVRPRLASPLTAPTVSCAGSLSPEDTATVAWGRAIHGRSLDTLTLAVVVREERADGADAARTTIVLNASKGWNAGDDDRPDEGGAPLDLVTVLAETLAALAEGSTIDATERPAAASDDLALGGRAAREPPARLLPRAAADPCAGGSGALVNPRLLIFDSVDHARMNAYQVGFFLPRAASPVTTVDMPLTAFLERRVFDLPDGELAAMRRTLVASIPSAGLVTPLGHVYTYRVRGVWSGGTTAWSAPSPSFVRCPR